MIHNALEWANKRLELQGEPITENQRNYIVFALRQQLTIPAVVGQGEQLKPEEQICYKSNKPCKHDCSGLCRESC